MSLRDRILRLEKAIRHKDLPLNIITNETGFIEALGVDKNEFKTQSGYDYSAALNRVATQCWDKESEE